VTTKQMAQVDLLDILKHMREGHSFEESLNRYSNEYTREYILSNTVPDTTEANCLNGRNQ
jgi:hypothetical protein